MLYSCTATAPGVTGTSMTNRELCQSCWKALEYLFNNGKARAIGVSNFEVNHIQDIVDLKGLLPAVNQVEYHPFWHEDDLVEYCQKMCITFNGYAPLGASGWGPHRDEDDLVEYCQKMCITFNGYAPLGASDWGPHRERMGLQCSQ